MSKLKKIVFSIIFFLFIAIFIRNISVAGWVDDYGRTKVLSDGRVINGFIRDSYDSYNYNYRAYQDGRNLKPSLGYYLHITDNIYIHHVKSFENRAFGGSYPNLDSNTRYVMFTTYSRSKD